MNRSKQTGFVLGDQQRVLLDVVRAIAASIVLLHHMFLLIGRSELSHGVELGSLGVTTFFLLSGFLIDQAAQRRSANNYSLREFLIDRAARIYVCFVPALVFTAALVAPISGRPDFVGYPNFGVTQFIGNLLMLQDYPIFQVARRVGIDADWFVRPYALAEPYWTVPIELYLYIGFGVAYFGFLKGRARLNKLTLVLTVIAAVPIIYHAATGYGQCLTLTWVVGVLASRLMSTRFGDAQIPQLAAPSTRFVFGWLALAAVLLALRMTSRAGNFYDLQKTMFMAMILVGGLWAVTRVRWLAHPLIQRPAAFFAKTSYPLYLTHNVLVGWTVTHLGKDLHFAELAMVALSSHAAAFVFWWAFDRHYKAVAVWVRNWTAPAAELAPAAISSAAVASTAAAEAEVVRG
jgi:peptidoglycan/LPS O-acetylase OafA/YrhL